MHTRDMTTTTAQLVRPATCRRCSGTGFVDARPNAGLCYACSGAGEVESDRAAIAARKARAELRRQLGHAAFEHSVHAHYGLNLLEQNEPERLTRAMASFAAGHPGVLAALEAYARAARTAA